MKKRDIEGILLLSGDGVDISELSKFFKVGLEEIKKVLEELRFENERRGINIEIKEERVRLVTNPICGETIHNFFNREGSPKKLSKQAMETLTIIAYKEPITKGEIEKIRGVAVDGVVNSLEEKKLIYICGRRNTPGRPKLYSVTEHFLAYVGIDTLEDLPSYNEIRNGKGPKGEDGTEDIEVVEDEESIERVVEDKGINSGEDEDNGKDENQQIPF